LKKSVIWAHLFVVLYTVKLIAGGAASYKNSKSLALFFLTPLLSLEKLAMLNNTNWLAIH
jgi:hypothetical protein